MLNQSKMTMPDEPIERFDQELEWGKYIVLSPLYIRDHKDEVTKSINGGYEEVRRKFGVKPLRGSERDDITWVGSVNAQDAYDRAMWYSVRYRIINLKVCCDGYAVNHGGKAKFYEDLYAKIPRGKIELPNGKEEYPFEIVRLIRNVMAHDGSEEKKDDKAKRIELGMDDIYEFLMTPYCFVDDGEKVKMASYDLNNEIIRHTVNALCSEGKALSICNCKECLYTLIENECAAQIRTYDTLLNGTFKDEASCIEENFWRPLEFV